MRDAVAVTTEPQPVPPRPRAATRIFVPSQEAASWAAGLADPDKQWRTGFSAKTLAACWQDADDFPLAVRTVLGRAPYPVFHEIEMLLAVPEWKVPLPGGSRASQTDLFVLARAAQGLVAITVEGKVDEPFDKTVDEWLAGQGSPSTGKQRRLAYLADELGIEVGDVGRLRYQLLHRTVSALIEARRFTARHALMLVHSFSPEALWLDDYLAFATALDAAGPAKDAISRVGERGGVELYVGWCSGDQRWRQDEP
jgi:hypothetical protein